MTVAEDQPRLAELLEAAAAELERLAERTRRLGALVEQPSGTLPAGAVEEAQAVDFVAQHLDGLGLYLQLLAAQTPPSLRLAAEALRGRLSLTDLERRLTGEACTPDAPTGDLELF